MQPSTAQPAHSSTTPLGLHTWGSGTCKGQQGHDPTLWGKGVLGGGADETALPSRLDLEQMGGCEWGEVVPQMTPPHALQGLIGHDLHIEVNPQQTGNHCDLCQLQPPL